MARIEIYGDEAGNFSFSEREGASTYFIVTTVTMTENVIAHRLLNLRQELMWSGVRLASGFHAYQDTWPVRTAVLREIAASGLRIDSTIIPKARVGANLRRSNLLIWQFAWLTHLQRVVPRVTRRADDLMVVAASIRTQMRADAVDAGLHDIVGQVRAERSVAHVVNANSDMAVQAADYCGWAIQRKWERGDFRAHGVIRHLIGSEQVLFESER